MIHLIKSKVEKKMKSKKMRFRSCKILKGKYQLIVNDLINMMENILIDSPSSAYSYRHMDRKLREHFGDSIVFTSLPGKIQVVKFIQKASTVLHEFYHGKLKNQNPEEEKASLIKTAAKLIRDDIKLVQANLTEYPNFLPESLKLFLISIISTSNSTLRIASLGQAIMQGSRPRGIQAPLQVGLGVQLHTKYASRNLLDSLHSMGFCCS